MIIMSKRNKRRERNLALLAEVEAFMAPARAALAAATTEAEAEIALDELCRRRDVIKERFGLSP